MAGKAKSVYLTINPKGTLKTAFHKVFFDAKAYNDYVKTDEFKAKQLTTIIKTRQEISNGSFFKRYHFLIMNKIASILQEEQD